MTEAYSRIYLRIRMEELVMNAKNSSQNIDIPNTSQVCYCLRQFTGGGGTSHEILEPFIILQLKERKFFTSIKYFVFPEEYTSHRTHGSSCNTKLQSHSPVSFFENVR